jgi:sorbitol-specific phosphotransferase system component IIA
MFAAVEEGELQEGFDGVLKYAYSTGGTEATVIQDDSYQQLTEVVIPATATLDGKTYQVTAVGNSAFYECDQLMSVTLPDGLVSIGNYSFSNTGLQEMTFPTSLKSIGDGAFESCHGVKSLILPEGLESIGRNSFSNMSNLQKATLPSSLTAIGGYAFFYNMNMSSVESHIAEPFDIPESAFASSATWDNVNYVDIYSPSSATLYVPVGTRSKYESAQGWNMFAAVEEGELQEGFDGVLKYAYSTAGSKATVIPDDSYQELTGVVIPATATLGGKSYQVTAVGNSAFRNCYQLTSVTLPEGLVSIGRYSFQNVGVNEITFPATLKSIGDGAFEDCYNVTSVVIPEGVEKIGHYAFSYMGNLERIILPSTLTEIGSYLLRWDGKLTTVVSNIPEPFAVADATFIFSSQWNNETRQEDYAPSPAMLYVPKGTVAVYQNTAGWNWFAGISEFGDGNGDGTVTMADAMATVNYILGVPPAGFNTDAVDINGDGKVTVSDAAGVVNIIVNSGK